MIELDHLNDDRARRLRFYTKIFGRLYFKYNPKLNIKNGEFKHEVRQFEKSYDNQQAEQISLMV